LGHVPATLCGIASLRSYIAEAARHEQRAPIGRSYPRRVIVSAVDRFELSSGVLGSGSRFRLEAAVPRWERPMTSGPRHAASATLRWGSGPPSLPGRVAGERLRCQACGYQVRGQSHLQAPANPDIRHSRAAARRRVSAALSRWHVRRSLRDDNDPPDHHIVNVAETRC